MGLGRHPDSVVGEGEEGKRRRLLHVAGKAIGIGGAAAVLNGRAAGGVAGKTFGAVEGGVERGVGVRVVAGDARERSTRLEAAAGGESGGLVADRGGVIERRGGAVAFGAELHRLFRAEL